MIEWIIDTISTELLYLTICVMILSLMALLYTVRLWFHVRQQRMINSSLQSRIAQLERKVRVGGITGARADAWERRDQDIVGLLESLREMSESIKRTGSRSAPSDGGE